VSDDDRQAIADCLAGRAAAFDHLVRRYQDRLYNAVLRIADNPDDALDVVQDSFLNAYQSLGSFKGDAEFYTWLYRIAFNSAVSQRRKKRPVVSLDAGRNGSAIADPLDDSEGIKPGAALERSEQLTTLYAALSRLSVEHRAVLVMKDIDGLKYEQIADVMGVPIGTVRSRLHRARLELRDLLVSAEGEENMPAGLPTWPEPEREGEGSNPHTTC
jgi:RNA polymerase sigma-70 factor (ECF subfamily)